MAQPNKELTEQDIENLRKLYGVINDFHQEVKDRARQDQNNLALRNVYEDILKVTSDKLVRLSGRIQRAEMAVYRKTSAQLKQAATGTAARP
jgi:hypothetical protein